MITGVVLSGGGSTRMGSDKGMLRYASQTWAEIAFNKLSALNIPVVVSVNPVQYKTYQAVFSEKLLVTDNEALNIGGPLKGVLSVHRQYPKNDLLVLAVDILNISTDLLQQLCTYHLQCGDEVIAYKHERQTEPLCAIYKATALNKIVQLHEEAKLTKHSMHFILEHLQVVYIDVPFHQAGKFANFNSADDLQNLAGL